MNIDLDRIGPQIAVEAEELSPSRGQGRRRKVVEVDPEPEYELVAVEEGAAPVMPRLEMNATCDYCALLCETPSVNFKSTMMFQTRTHTFPIQNTSEVELRFTFDIRSSNGGPEPLRSCSTPAWLRSRALMRALPLRLLWCGVRGVGSKPPPPIHSKAPARQ